MNHKSAQATKGRKIINTTEPDKAPIAFGARQDPVYREPPEPSKIVSTGGSSSYYEVHLDEVAQKNLKEKGHLVLGDIFRCALDNDYDKCCILKAEMRLGKKAGTSCDYDLNKIDYHSKLLRERYGENQRQ